MTVWFIMRLLGALFVAQLVSVGEGKLHKDNFKTSHFQHRLLSSRYGPPHSGSCSTDDFLRKASNTHTPGPHRKISIDRATARESWGRIVGGVNTTITEYPFIAQLGIDGFQYCAASILSSEWAVTAAHCLYSAGERLANTVLTLRAGTTTRNNGGIIYNVANSIMHGQYDHQAQNFDYDITLLKVAEPFSFSEDIQPISLAPQEIVLTDGSTATVVGWGNLVYDATNGQGSDILQKLDVSIVGQQDCSVFDVPVTDRMICAAVPDWSKNTCQGDSGGPLFVDEGVLVGIISWGAVGCNVTNFPGVYTRVSELRNWIFENSGL